MGFGLTPREVAINTIRAHMEDAFQKQRTEWVMNNLTGPAPRIEEALRVADGTMAERKNLHDQLLVFLDEGCPQEWEWPKMRKKR